MKTQFELKSWMTENRETVINNYSQLATEPFFNGITLKEFMIEVMRIMTINNPKSDKRAASLLPYIISNVYASNCEVQVVNDLDEKLAAKYQGTAYMALV